MLCKGCYKEIVDGYCLSCRKKLFGKIKIASVLDFDAPKAENLGIYQEYSKQLSVSGVQLKYSLTMENHRLELSKKDRRYILKPIPPAQQLKDLADVPENEHLTMQIAEQVFGIKTAANALIYFKDGLPAYITKRFDVANDGKKILQEDFAQLSNRTKKTHGETYKYDGSYEEIGSLIIRFVPAYMPALEQFFTMIIFNYVVSNGDAHLKNFSLTTDENGESRLTPAYDLLSTVLHTPMESDVALNLYPGDIHSAFYSRYGYYGKPNFQELAIKLGMIPKRADRIIDSFLPKQNLVENFIRNSFLSEPVKERYRLNVDQKLKRLAHL